MLGEFYRSLGLELSGAKNDRTTLAILDYYPKTERLVLVDIEAKIMGTESENSDEILVQRCQELAKAAPRLTGLAVHGPVSLPPAFSAEKDSPVSLAHRSRDPEVRWMNQVWKKIRPRPRPFLPYLQRPAEIWLRHLTSERFQIGDALGANAAPLSARLHFLRPHLPQPLNEVFPRASMHRLVSSLGFPRSLARDYADVERGLGTRQFFFELLVKKLPQLFLYEKDLEQMILNLSSFQAFLAAFTQHLVHMRQVEVPPPGFPRKASWIHIPRQHVAWDQVFKKR